MSKETEEIGHITGIEPARRKLIQAIAKYEGK